MSMTNSFLATLLLVGMTTGTGHSQNLGAYLSEKDGRKELKESLTLREEQGGIAGTTGRVWTVEPSGQWRVARFRTRGGKENLTTVGSGTLSPAELEALANVLAAQDLTGLPEKTGHEPKVNPHNVTLKFGKKTATLTGLPARRSHTLADHIRKSAADKPQADGGVWERFAHVVQAVETHCPAAEKP
jgi:hypothetical protein